MKHTEIPDGQWNVHYASGIHAAMSGCCAAGQHRDGSITLKYTNGEEETAHFADPPALDTLSENWFALVDVVQSAARIPNAAEK